MSKGVGNYLNRIRCLGTLKPMDNQIEARKKLYYDLSIRLACVDTKQLTELAGGEGARGWGRSQTIDIDTSKVFVKRIPVTQLEYENMFSTENIFNIPAIYHYGVGSAGFSAFRELAAHVKTTNWVLDGDIANFPLMYHYRIVPNFTVASEPDAEQHAGYVKYWNSDPGIDRYMLARHAAGHEMILCLEHFPHALNNWLTTNQDKAEVVTAEMLQTIGFLREHGILHFDAHLANIVVNGDTPYLTDFGLVLDRNFAIAGDERAFFELHADYDLVTFLTRIAGHVYVIFGGLPSEEKKKAAEVCGLSDDAGFIDTMTALIVNVETLHDGRLMNLDTGYVGLVVKYRDIALTLLRFYQGLLENDRKDTPYPHSEFRRLLDASR